MIGWKKAVTTAMVATSLTAAAGAMAASNDIFIKIGDIKGESADSKHRGEIDVVSWSWGLAQTGGSTGGGGGAGKAHVHDISIVKHIDAASPSLFMHAAEGRHIGNVQLTVRKAGGRAVDFIKIKLDDVLVSSITSAVKGDETVEHVTLNFGRIEYEYTPVGADGSPGTPVKFSWDVKANRGK